MKTTVELTGAAEWKAKLHAMGPAVFAAMVKSAYQSFEAVMTTSKEEYVPVDQGTLRSSGHVQSPEVSGMSATITMGYGGPAAPYAIAVHENPRAGKTGGLSPSGKPYEHWARTGGWKYLETPLKAATGQIAAKLKDDVDAAHVRLK
jgi:hypothetical protein